MPAKNAHALDREFLQIRADLLTLAAALDRVQREKGFDADDERWTSIQAAIGTLAREEDNRAEQIQHIFSLPYRQNWRESFEL